jgi:hypothetical protein
MASEMNTITSPASQARQPTSVTAFNAIDVADYLEFPRNRVIVIGSRIRSDLGPDGTVRIRNSTGAHV